MTDRILIDGYFLGKPYGFGRFISELLLAISRAAKREASDVDLVVACRPGVAMPEEWRDAAVRSVLLPITNLPVWQQAGIPWLARKLSAQVVHYPYNTGAVYTPGATTVVSVHDLLFLDHSPPPVKSIGDLKQAVYQRYTRAVFRPSVSRADHRVSVSDTTAAALNSLGLESRRIYNTADGFLSHAVGREPLRTVRPYLLHRGGAASHRNTGRVIEAFRSLRSTFNSALDLRIVGVPEGAELWQTLDDPSIIFEPRLTDDQLISLYLGSHCVVATSLMEGFGLPIIEAFGLGVPVITSSVNPMMEVAGDAALLVDPSSTSAIAAGIARILEDRQLRADLADRGRRRYTDFSGDRIGNQYLDLYRQAAAGSR